MIIRELEVARFRNLNSVTLCLNQQFNYLYGDNGAGKTALLEAVHMLARGRSFRGRRIAPVIQHDARSLLVRAELEGGHSLGISRDRSGKTELHVDRVEARRLSDAAALLPIQSILPDVGQLIFGGPGDRRQCLDWGMFHVKQGYLSAHRAYLAAVRQRNAVLKSWGDTDSGQVIGVWTEAVCREAEAVDGYRQDYVAELAPHLQTALAALEAGVAIEMAYKNGWGDDELVKILGESLRNDVKSGSTGAGPHRADLSLTITGRDAGSTLSRGQGKLVAIALILAQAQLLKDCTGQRTVFLIDDLGAELDGVHGSRLLTLLRASGCQVISTSTRPPGEEFGVLYGRGNIKMFHVKQGRITVAQPGQAGWPE